MRYVIIAVFFLLTTLAPAAAQNKSNFKLLTYCNPVYLDVTGKKPKKLNQAITNSVEVKLRSAHIFADAYQHGRTPVLAIHFHTTKHRTFSYNLEFLKKVSDSYTGSSE